MQFNRHTLPNGLEVIAECDPAALSLAMGFFVQTGSRDEAPLEAGVSHFLEHMVFKGTARRTAEDVNREFDELGAHYNAFTSEESTVYYASLLPEHQAPAVDLLADILRPSLRTEDFNMEKKVILEEIEMYLDQPPYGMDDYIKRLCFGEHPIAGSVLGTAESVSALTPEAMRSYFERRYSPGNVVLAAAGKVDFDALVKQAEAACGEWKPVETSRQLPKATVAPKREAIVQSSAMQQYALLLGDAPDGRSADRYAAKLLATVLGDDSGSRLYWRLIDPGLAESASLGHYDYQGIGMFYTWLSCEPDDFEENLAAVEETLASIRTEPPTATELAHAKSKIKSRVVLGSERPRSRLFNVGGGWQMRGDYRPLEEDLARLDAVTIDDLVRVAAEHPLDRNAVVTVGPREGLVL
ncbi:M16 family metallopeptidase [Botrimarina mediterranea]|uniref:Protease 3 n=1 Tax=Botrimarina mediterranea TaxID=2528022 RepID=A0A518K3G7_9BACT|nr:pitrilysin family protein [Botrimarina mediterranea]QDV72344.1 Protease 3 precursor [Botrimarina mediterranea]QDV76889.1 Protease 3 precursor [Planctomycetes bacterium K2D]